MPTVRLKTELRESHAIYGVESIPGDPVLSVENPTIELTDEQANDLMNAAGISHVFEVVESDGKPANKVELQAEYLAVLGHEADKRLSVTSLIDAIAEAKSVKAQQDQAALATPSTQP